MEHPKTFAVSDLRTYFRNEIRVAMQNQGLNSDVLAIDYLVDLLAAHMESAVFFRKANSGKLENNVLAHIYGDYLQGGVEVKKLCLKRLGDVCLIVTGFFSDSLNKKIVDLDYYFGMGGGAYWTLSKYQMQTNSRELYKELSVKFKPFSNVLGEISDRSGITNSKDILRVYEKWLLTGSKHLKKCLAQSGISTPIKIDRNKKH